MISLKKIFEEIKKIILGDKNSKPLDIETLKKSLKYIGKYKLLLPISIGLALVSVAISLYIPILIGNAIDSITDAGNVDMDVVSSKLLTSCALIGIVALSNWLMNTINNRISYHVLGDIRNEAFDKVVHLPLSYVDSTPHGDIVNRVINDTDKFAEGLLLAFTQVFTGSLTIIGTLVFMLVINWKIALAVVLLTPLSILVAKYIGKETYHMHIERSKNEAEQASFINETLSNQKLVRAFGQERKSINSFDVMGDKLERSTLKAIFFSSLTNPTTRFVNSMVYAAVALIGALTVLGNTAEGIAFTVGQFSVLLSYTNQYTKPFNEISGIFAEFQSAIASAKRVFDLIEEPSEVEDDIDSIDLANPKGNISMNDVRFSYNKENTLIEGLNINVASGERVAIVGPTGCGKTTIINLLMRFYDVDDGEITVDSTNVKKIKRSNLRRSFGMVLQDTWLRKATVKENIAIANPNATEEEIIDAAKRAHAHSFIKRLKNGYDTIIGEGGEGLSQGQKQLICIARVMLNLPPMLILDEATSSIDTRTEIKIQKALTSMMNGRTSFIVAHRLSTVKEADLILVMKDGKIIEQGTHNDLLDKNGFYYELYNSQFAH